MNLISYIKESFQELRNKVSWISWEEAQKSTVVVAIFSIIFALSVFFVDKVFQSILTEYFKLFLIEIKLLYSLFPMPTM